MSAMELDGIVIWGPATCPFPELLLRHPDGGDGTATCLGQTLLPAQALFQCRLGVQQLAHADVREVAHKLLPGHLQMRG